MTATFLVTLEVEDTSEMSLTQDATLIGEILADNGLPVLDCQPWSRQNAMPSTHTDLSMLASVFPSATPQTIQPIQPI